MTTKFLSHQQKEFDLTISEIVIYIVLY